MKNNLFLHSFESLNPQFLLPQKELVDWILRAHATHHPEGDERLWRKFCISDQYISQRYIECNDVSDDWQNNKIYHLTKETPEGAKIGERNKFFSDNCARVFDHFYQNRTPEHLVHVTCTGYVSPSPGQQFFSNKKIYPEMTHAYHMGCYASLPAIRIAEALSSYQQKEIDIIHTEMCSLHLNAAVHTPEQFVVQTLFADGFINYRVSSERKGYRILNIHEKIVPNSANDMTWVPDAFGMKMRLSREVPNKISEWLPLFIDELANRCALKREDLLRDAVFAIHPGGPKIIDGVKTKLELEPWQVEVSHKILFERGNMSSATLPHVWKEIVESDKYIGKKVVSLAFGPGLTIFGAVFEVV